MTHQPASTTRPRLAYWDNAKWLAMALVVVGHIVQPLVANSDAALVAYLTIYAFHMPLFGVISGYFTTENPTAKHYARVVTDLLLPYLIFEFIWSLIRSLIRGNFSFDPTTASWTLWFLLSLAAFRLLLPVIARLKFPLVWVVAAAVLVGYWDGVDQTLSAMRTIGMLPFFVLGWQLRQWNIMDRWATARHTLVPRIAAIAVFVATVALFALLPDFWRDMDLRHYFFLDRPFADIAGGEHWYDGGIRLAVMACTTLLIAAALVLIPRRDTFFSPWGRATMFIYLLHTFVLYWPRESGFIAQLSGPWWMVLVAVIVGVALTALLSTKLVQLATGWIVEPKLGFLIRSERVTP